MRLYIFLFLLLHVSFAYGMQASNTIFEVSHDRIKQFVQYHQLAQKESLRKEFIAFVRSKIQQIEKVNLYLFQPLYLLHPKPANCALESEPEMLCRSYAWLIKEAYDSVARRSQANPWVNFSDALCGSEDECVKFIVDDDQDPVVRLKIFFNLEQRYHSAILALLEETQ